MTEEMRLINQEARARMLHGARASETGCMFKGDEANLEDKALFVAWLGELLTMTREEVVMMELEDEDTAKIIWKGGYEQMINIAADSRLAIIKDTLKQGDF